MSALRARATRKDTYHFPLQAAGSARSFGADITLLNCTHALQLSQVLSLDFSILITRLSEEH